MIIKSKTLKSILTLIKVLPVKQRKGLISLIPISVASGIADLLVIIIVSELFTAIINNGEASPLPFSSILPEQEQWRIIALIIIYIVLNWFSSLSKIITKACQLRLKINIWRDLCEISQRKIMSQNYEYFISNKQENHAASILINVGSVSDVIVFPLMRLISGIFVIMLITTAMLFVGKEIVFYLMITLIVAYFSITSLITPFLRLANSKRIDLQIKTNNIITESISNILDIKLTGSDEYYQNKYSREGRKFISHIWKAELLPDIPRAFIEPFGITLIFAFGMLSVNTIIDTRNFLELVPFLATVAITSLKLTPPLQDVFRSIVELRGGLPTLEEALKIISLKDKRSTFIMSNIYTSKSIKPRKNIILDHVSYNYPSNPKPIIKDVYMNITVGSRVAFVGRTGSGKSTTARLILSLLTPTQGSLIVDGIQIKGKVIPLWQANCSYVPQSINLLSSSIIDNIAFGQRKDKVDLDRVWNALEKAQLADYISSMDKGLDSSIGVNGISLSEGQRQRIALARAFYRKSEFLILDEATSSLDSKTEKNIMDSIDLIGPDCTIIIIAHRLSTIYSCNHIFKFSNGRITEQGGAGEMIDSHRV
tara:strand:+ start:172 stop:1959 length:1788 start_codon:yes stop_codon:yes gene_type:complete